MDKFKIKAHIRPYTKIREHYEGIKDKEKKLIDNSVELTKEETYRLYGQLGRFKKMAKNEMIILWLEEHIEEFEKLPLSKNMLLDVFKELFERQPNQNVPILDRFQNEDITRAQYQAFKKISMEHIKKIEKYDVLKEALDY